MIKNWSKPGLGREVVPVPGGAAQAPGGEGHSEQRTPNNNNNKCSDRS